MICAVAPDLEAALSAVEQKCDYCMNSFPNNKPSKVLELGDDINPEAWVCYGGG
jgi:hypothetical protein